MSGEFIPPSRGGNSLFSILEISIFNLHQNNSHVWQINPVKEEFEIEICRESEILQMFSRAVKRGWEMAHFYGARWKLGGWWRNKHYFKTKFYFTTLFTSLVHPVEMLDNPASCTWVWALCSTFLIHKITKWMFWHQQKVENSLKCGKFDTISMEIFN